jgi:hypothetical protein
VREQSHDYLRFHAVQIFFKLRIWIWPLYKLWQIMASEIQWFKMRMHHEMSTSEFWHNLSYSKVPDTYFEGSRVHLPCFDDFRLRTPFFVTLGRPSGAISISNAPMIATTKLSYVASLSCFESDWENSCFQIQ